MKTLVEFYNEVKILSLELNEKEMEVTFIKDFDKDIIEERFNITQDTKDPNVLKEVFNKYLDGFKGNRSLKEYLEDIQKYGFESQYYSGLDVKVIELQ